MSQPNEISPLTLAIVAGVFAIGGTVIGQVFGLFSGWIQRRHDRKMRKKKEIDEIGAMMIDAASWFHSLYTCRNNDELLALKPPPHLASIVLYTRLSFPSLVPHAEEFRDKCVEHYGLVLMSYNPAIPMTPGGQIVDLCNKDHAFRDKMDSLPKVRKIFEDALVAESQKLGSL